MDSSPDLLAATVRAKRLTVDQDLDRLRLRLRRADPRRLDTGRLARGVAVPLALGTALWLWQTRRRRRVHSLRELLIRDLSDLRHTAQQLVPALERMQTHASHPELEHAFAQHRHETEGQITRLDRVFELIGAQPVRTAGAAVPAIVHESEQLLRRRQMQAGVRDAWLLTTAQRIAHLEIAGYGTARTYAQTLGYTDASRLLQQTLEEEWAADRKLTRLAERFVNPQTAHAA